MTTGRRKETMMITDHDFLPVAGHPDDYECTYRADGTDATYCGEAWTSIPARRCREAVDIWRDYQHE